MLRRRADRLLLAAVCAHNGEEALTYAHFRPRAEALMAKLGGHDVVLLVASTFYLMLAAVTLAAAIALASADRLPLHRRALPGIVIAGILLANVVIPHVPAAILLGGYAPGVVTALLVNLPLAITLLRRERSIE